MTVIATPVLSPFAELSPACEAQRSVAPVITKLYGKCLPTKRRAVSVSQSQTAILSVQLLDQNGNPVILSDCSIGGAQSFPGQVLFRIRETLSRCATPDEYSATVTDPENGIVQTVVPTTITMNPGVYDAEFAVFDGMANLVFSNLIYLWVERGLFGLPENKAGGPPSLQEIRLFIRDNSPIENLLINNFEFDLADVCEAAAYGVSYWNEAQPPIGVGFTTITYPVSLYWTIAIAGNLLISAASRFRRNTLPYQAGGISIDDQNKEQQYTQAGLSYLKDYREWVKLKKVQMNCEMAITSSYSPYSFYAFFNN